MTSSSYGIGVDPWGLLLLWLALALPAAIVCVLGRAAHGTRRPALKALGLSASAALVLAAIALTQRDPDVSSGDAAIGVAVAAVGLGALPAAIFFALGLLIRPKWLGALLWFLLTLPLVVYAVLGWLVVAAYVSCPPDAHECPI